MMMRQTFLWAACAALAALPLHGREIFVDASAKTCGRGTQAEPFKTVQAAANLAQPGDVITIADGVYRERIDPPRGGKSDKERITFRAAPGARPVLSGSEPFNGDWREVEPGIWKKSVEDAAFAVKGGFNPFLEPIRGDWFYNHGNRIFRASLMVDGVRNTMTDNSLEALRNVRPGNPLLNVERIAIAGANPVTIHAGTAPVATEGLKAAADGLTWVYAGAWARYNAPLKSGDTVTFKVAASAATSAIEIRDEKPEGALLGSVPVAPTGGWAAWRDVAWRVPEGVEAKAFCLRFVEKSQSPRLRWTFERAGNTSHVYVRFPEDPAKHMVEISARPMVFYPSKTGINYITLKDLTLKDASPNWAPPTAEQEGIVGTNWSRGWVIEDCEVANSSCSGIALGKFGDLNDNYAGSNSQIFTDAIAQAGGNGWERVGHHIVRRCRIHNCGQTGVVGSLGAVFSTIEDCVIYDIYRGERFTGAEQSGIKIHGAVDMLIANNRISDTGAYGVWLDWMAQGTRVTRNVIVNVGGSALFFEVNHGPILADNNILCAGRAIRANSHGVAYVNNLINGDVWMGGDGRRTPFFKPHSIKLAKMEERVVGGDARFVGNVWVRPHALNPNLKLPSVVKDNVQIPADAVCVRHDHEGAVTIGRTPAYDAALKGKAIATPTAESLGTAAIPQMGYVDRQGKPFDLSHDLTGAPRGETSLPGPWAK